MLPPLDRLNSSLKTFREVKLLFVDIWASNTQLAMSAAFRSLHTQGFLAQVYAPSPPNIQVAITNYPQRVLIFIRKQSLARKYQNTVGKHAGDIS